MLSGFLVGLLFIAVLMPTVRQVDNLVFSGYINFLDNVLSRIVGLYGALTIITLFGFQFTVWVLFLPIALYFVQNCVSLLRHWDTILKPVYVGWAIGDLSGFIIGYLAVKSMIPGLLLAILFGIMCLPAIYMYLTSKQASYEFWNLAAKFPDKAYDLFCSDSCWYLDESKMIKKNELVGPFSLFVPKLDRRIKIWGDAGKIEDSQRKFIERLSPRDRKQK
ncbi:MAG: hypothetical protein A2X29_06030 [Elusimicrobia bacterium GWA2_64_40]|nr:MAG: hypothetical protein A2X29_06030 [Elusimicrobia bacterium GWA2_64_40]